MPLAAGKILEEIATARDCYGPEILARYAAIRQAHEYSNDLLVKVRTAIAASPPDAACKVHVLATAGSLARLEASDQSDLDLIMTVNPVREGDEAADLQALKEWRNQLCERLGIDKPNPKGVFIDPTCRTVLETISGGAEEAYQDVAKRILFILESQWLYSESEHDTLIDAIIDKDSMHVKIDTRKNFVFLLNDVVRFFRQLCVNYQFTTDETADGKWPLRNIKLRHSRVIMYFSMIAALGALSRCYDKDKIKALKDLVKLPPLERLFVAYKISGDEGFFRVAGSYNTFLHLLSQQEARDELFKLEYPDRYKSAIFGQLKANSDGLSSELLRFYEARRGGWDDRFFEYMIL